MIKPELTFDEYSKLSNEEKSDAFNRLVNRIVIVHPEYVEEAKNQEASDIVKEIAEMTDVDVNKQKPKSLVRRLLRR
jgi:hypothetical protein